ncbi:hypothetical protein PPYR_10528 [Photinus pyralis]|uniref:Uncharacterized protein n=1 Tax=Photinus pyralis TaxID=7054 RepID=A0A5N4AGL6_PHOPY|nr:hypothetical protein PPYR_10528 [Photinus pyralis]
MAKPSKEKSISHAIKPLHIVMQLTGHFSLEKSTGFLKVWNIQMKILCFFCCAVHIYACPMEIDNVNSIAMAIFQCYNYFCVFHTLIFNSIYNKRIRVILTEIIKVNRLSEFITKEKVNYLLSRRRMIIYISFWYGFQIICGMLSHFSVYNYERREQSKFYCMYIGLPTNCFNFNMNCLLQFILGEIKERSAKVHNHAVLFQESEIYALVKNVPTFYHQLLNCAQSIKCAFEFVLLSKIVMCTIHLLITVYWFTTGKFKEHLGGNFILFGLGSFIVLNVIDVVVVLYSFVSFIDEVNIPTLEQNAPVTIFDISLKTNRFI